MRDENNQLIFVIFAQKFFNDIFLFSLIVKVEEHLIAASLCMIACLLTLFTSSLAAPFEIDVTATVYKVIDGDTFDAFPVGRVRLADVNAPELGDPGGYEAKEALTDLVSGKVVYLDVDDKYVMDKYGRLVCVVYVRINSETIMNVNKWLLENGYVEVKNYDNEFDPENWALFEKYVEREGGQTPKTTTITSTETLTHVIEKPVTIERVSTVTVVSTFVTTEKLTETFYSTTTLIKYSSEGVPMIYLILIVFGAAFFIILMLYAILRRR